jgi:sulfate adenylyltransferase (ADP) / ATP adenylyltransferase
MSRKGGVPFYFPKRSRGWTCRPNFPIIRGVKSGRHARGLRDEAWMSFERGTLWRSLALKTEEASRKGALVSLPTEFEFIEDGGVRFLVRILMTLKLKDAARSHLRDLRQTGPRVDPFLPYEEDLFVTDLSDTHLVLLNKFKVIDHHFLIVTREFEDQEMLLTPKDFEALWTCLAEFNGLGFYNGGPAAGASQTHKHLQIVPLPLAPEGPAVPIETLLPAERGVGRPMRLPGMPFQHSFTALDSNSERSPLKSAAVGFDAYCRMMERVGLEGPERGRPKRQSAPYCLLATRDWMLLAPRTREHFGSVSINALGLAGALFVRDRSELDLLKSAGPMRALREVARPFPPGGIQN